MNNPDSISATVFFELRGTFNANGEDFLDNFKTWNGTSDPLVRIDSLDIIILRKNQEQSLLPYIKIIGVVDLDSIKSMLNGRMVTHPQRGLPCYGVGFSMSVKDLEYLDVLNFDSVKVKIIYKNGMIDIWPKKNLFEGITIQKKPIAQGHYRHRTKL